MVHIKNIAAVRDGEINAGATPDETDNSRPASVRSFLLIALVYAFTLKLALFFPDMEGVLAAVWPPSGVALAILLLTPRRQWRAILAVIFITGCVVNLMSGRLPFASVGFMVADVLEPWGCAWLMTRYCEGRRITFARVDEVMALSVCATLVNSVTAIPGAAVAVISHAAPFKEFYLTWWIADGLGILLVTPLIVICFQPWRGIVAARGPRLLEALTLGLLWCACVWLGFIGIDVGLPVVPRPYWIFLPLVWAALRFDVKGTVVLLALLNMIAISLTAAGRGVFPLGGGNRIEHLQMVQLFLGAFTLTGLVLAAAVSERKHAESQLRETLDRLALATRVGGVGIWEYDIAADKLVWDDQMFHLYGIPREQFSGAYNAWRAGIHPEDRQRCDEETQLALRGEKAFDTEFRVLWPNGSTHDIRAICTVQRDDSGKALRMIGTNWDITARKQAEAVIHMSEERHRTILRTALSGFWRVDLQGRLLEVNQSYCQMSGYTEHELLTMRVSDLEAAENADSVAAHIRKVKEHGEGRFESRHRHKDGHVIDVEISVQYRDSDGGQLVAFVRDITERKRMEAEQEKANRDLRNALQTLQEMQAQMLQQARLSTLGQLSSGIAHDFNNILMPIIGYSELLLSTPAMLDNREKTLDAIRRINRAALDARQITSRLRWIYRPAEKASYLPVNVNDVVREALAMTQPRWDKELGAMGIRIRVTTKLEAHTPVLGDAAQLRESFMNLILNAVDAMPQGGDLTLSSAMEGPHVILCVADNGTGMTDEVKARCQEAFFTSKNASKGSGLGLTIVAGIVSRHKGTLEIESAPGCGTTVRLRLPCAPADATVSDSAQATTAAQPAPTHLRILLAEDDAEVLSLLEQILKNDGHHVEHARDGRIAVEKVGSRTFDLVITDRSMPRANGDAVARATKAHSPNTPVILLTGFGYLMNDAGECPPGVDLVLGKPISHHELRKAIQKVIHTA